MAAAGLFFVIMGRVSITTFDIDSIHPPHHQQ
jgi:hypothetical protein